MQLESFVRTTVATGQQLAHDQRKIQADDVIR
jgi:hypothetical protein